MTDVSAKITSKGQITLPREIRELLGVHDGDRVRFTVEGRQVRLSPERDQPDFSGMIGLAPLPAGQDARSFTADLRRDAPDTRALHDAPAHPNVTRLDP